MGLAVIASGMAGYFEWQVNLRRQMIGDADHRPDR
jgi:hypothetical protein